MFEQITIFIGYFFTIKGFLFELEKKSEHCVIIFVFHEFFDFLFDMLTILLTIF